MLPWHTIFAIILWQIWKDQNKKKSYDNFEYIISISAKLVSSYALEIVEAFRSPLINDSPGPRVTNWIPLSTGNVKLDTDGWWYETNGKGGFGGIFRDQKGDWILGYYGKLTCDSSLEAEIWGIYRGLTIILEKGLTNIRTELNQNLLLRLV